MKIARKIDKKIEKSLEPGRVLVIYGPRQVGKTTAVKQFLENFSGKSYYTTGEDAGTREILTSFNAQRIKTFFAGTQLFALDEAQTIPEIGKSLKFLVDNCPDLQVLATGSSSFELANRVGEPLVGRQKTLRMFPLSFGELTEHESVPAMISQREDLMIYGGYPAVFLQKTLAKKRELLKELSESYLYRDIIAFESIRNSDKIRKLLRLLAFQIGKEVSIHELAQQLELSQPTVARYLDLLEKSFVIFKIGGFSRNLRTEVTKTSRYYFFDNGMLNAILNQFQPLEMRADAGALWENWIVAERIRFNEYRGARPNYYFWRTYSQSEVDLIEEIDGTLSAFECKFGKKMPKAPLLWRKTYPEASFDVLSKTTFPQFLL